MLRKKMLNKSLKIMLVSLSFFFILTSFFLSMPMIGEAISNNNQGKKIKNIKAQIEKLKLLLNKKQQTQVKEKIIFKPVVFYNAVADLKAEAERMKPVSASSFSTSAIVSVSKAPVIDKIVPTTGAYGSAVTIYGQGFSQIANKIRLFYGTIDNIPSPDGKKLTFTMNLFKDIYDQVRANPQSWKDSGVLPVTLIIENDKGVSNQAIFNLNFKP